MQNANGRLECRPTYSNYAITSLALCALTILSARPVAAQLTQDAPRQVLKGHVTTEMMNAPVVSRVPSDTQLTLAIGLVLPNAAELTDTAAQISDPESPSYEKYLTPEQFANRFGAAPAAYQSVLDWAQENHLAAISHRNHFVTTVVGSVADIETALHIHLEYRLRPDGTEFFAADTEPSMQLSVPVEHIAGLDNFLRPERASGSGAGGAYQGTDFRNAYAPQMSQTGAGQKIGIFMFDGFAQSDINGYASQTHQSFLPVQIVPAGTALTPGEEGTLDIEASLSMAPAAQVVVFVDGNATSMLTNMTDREDIKQFSSSWFWYNGTTTDTNLMNQLAAQGQSFFQASGDGGAYQIGVFPKYISGSLDCRQFPSITLVGGTVLNMSSNGASYGTLETAWADSSGGIEASVGLPSYQSSIAGHNGASSTNRNVPDVSAQAADILIFWKGGPTNIGGTSEATPLWAGYAALVNELAANEGAASVGFANPSLYSIAASSAYDTDFHDIVSGCTPDSVSNTYCSGIGYDLTTGLGSPANNLIYGLSHVEAYPFYCQGPLQTSSGPNPLTPFKWASQGAGAATPGPGECAWADRGPRGTEIKPGDSNVIAGVLNQVANLPAGKFGEIGVHKNATTFDMDVTQVVGLVTPPFSSSVALP